MNGLESPTSNDGKKRLEFGVFFETERRNGQILRQNFEDTIPTYARQTGDFL